VASQAINISLLNAEKAQAHLIAYDAKFQNARANSGETGNYLKEYTYTPSVNPGTYVVRMPVPLSAPEMKAFKGRRHYRQNSTAFIDLTSVFYDDGVEEDVDRMAAFDWTGFSSTPEAISTVIDGWSSQKSAILLNSGESYTDWTGGNFLAATKYANPFKRSTSTTFKNYWSGAVLNTNNVSLLIADMVGRRGFNNLSLGFGIKGLKLFCSNALYPTAMSVCKDETLPGAASNPIVKYGIVPEAWPDLHAKRWGIIQTGPAMNSHPVFGALRGAEQVLVSGVGSAKYELENKMGHNVKIPMGVGLLRYEALSVAVEP
jgi:hypothetical protein